MYENIEKAVASWKTQNIELLPPLSYEQINQLFSNANYPVSADIVRLYSLCGGMSSNESLEEAANFTPPFIPFADGFISAQFYCFKIESPSLASVWVVQNKTPEFVASSLNEAFGFLLNEPTKLLLLS
jgi:hypothetical protein